MRQLIWFRNDLRINDNTALHAALQAGPTVAVFIITPRQWLAHDDAPCKVDFLLRNLAELEKNLATLNVPLLIRNVEQWQDTPELLAQLCTDLNISAVHSNNEYGVNESQRDIAAGTHLVDQGILFHSHFDQLLFKPGSVLTQSGTYFKVFSQFKKVCYQRLHDYVPECVATPQAQAALDIISDAIPSSVEGFAAIDTQQQALWPAGEQAAQQRLSTFAAAAMAGYLDQRDFPAKPGTSQLSAYLVAGVISIRQCLHAALAANQGEFSSGNQGAVTWINELLWREFYKHILVGYPKVSRHRAFKPETEFLAWRNAPKDLLAWQQGRTGIPIIDAAMRQLLATGWMHNRLRMIVAMFLTKNLLIDWREGERFFMQHLIDGCLAANNGGWQWSASTGTDAVPYFRVFNPVSQSQRFDPNGDFIRRWIPELKHLSNKEIHQPKLLAGLFGTADYPKPIVDLSASRLRAIAAFKSLPRAADL